MSLKEDYDSPNVEGIALAQGDLATNLFIVLLIITSVLTVAKVSEGNEGYRAPYSQGTNLRLTGAPMLGWQPILPAYPKLVLRDGMIHLVNLEPLAAAFVADQPMNLGADVFDSSRLLSGDLDPAANQIFLRIYANAPFPSELTRGSLAMIDFDGVAGEEFFRRFTDTAKLDLIVYPDDVATAVPLVDRLHGMKVALRIVVMPKLDVFGFADSGSNFGLQKSFK